MLLLLVDDSLRIMNYNPRFIYVQNAFLTTAKIRSHNIFLLLKYHVALIYVIHSIQCEPNHPTSLRSMALCCDLDLEFNSLVSANMTLPGPHFVKTEF